MKMAVTIKSDREIQLMREAGKRLAFVLSELEAYVKPGLSTYEIDKKGEELVSTIKEVCGEYAGRVFSYRGQ